MVQVDTARNIVISMKHSGVDFGKSFTIINDTKYYPLIEKKKTVFYNTRRIVSITSSIISLKLNPPLFFPFILMYVKNGFSL